VLTESRRLETADLLSMRLSFVSSENAEVYQNDNHLTIPTTGQSSQGFRAFHSAWRPIERIETVNNMIRKGR
jgi:hypothetical protein